MVATVPDVPDAFDFDTLGEQLDTSPIGVLLLSVGSPETKEDVEEYLYNVFCDPEILTLPPAFSWALKQPIAAFIAKTEAPAAREIMESVGGLSPQKATIDQQALALKQELANRGVSSKLYVAMRYWTPFADEAVEQMKADGIQKLVILPLYPQFSLSTSGSSLRVLERMLYTDPGFPMESTVVPAWYNRRGFLRATARAVAEALAALPDGGEGAHVLYSAQGLPRVYVEELGDPYEEQVRRTVELVTAQLAELGHTPTSHAQLPGAVWAAARRVARPVDVRGDRPARRRRRAHARRRADLVRLRAHGHAERDRPRVRLHRQAGGDHDLRPRAHARHRPVVHRHARVGRRRGAPRPLAAVDAADQRGEPRLALDCQRVRR